MKTLFNRDVNRTLKPPVRATARKLVPSALAIAMGTTSLAHYVFALWTAKQFSLAPGVRVRYEPASPFVPVLRIDSAHHAGSAAVPVQYAGFIAPAGTAPVLIAQLREAMLKVMAKDTLKAWAEVTGARVAGVNYPGRSATTILAGGRRGMNG